jgi:hypothetical protein
MAKVILYKVLTLEKYTNWKFLNFDLKITQILKRNLRMINGFKNKLRWLPR